MDLYRLTIQDSQDSMQFDLLDAPIKIEDVEGAVDNTVLSGDIFTDFLYLKKRWEQKWAIMCKDEYERLRGFYTRQWSLATVPSVKVTQGYLKDTEWEGQIIYINAPYGGEVSSLTKMAGDTFQQSYDGKNLVGFPTNSFTRDGLTFDFAEDGTITIDGTRTKTTASYCNDSSLFNFSVGNITMTIIPISGSFSGANIGYRTIGADVVQPWYQGYGSNGSYNQGTYNVTSGKLQQVSGVQLLIGSGTAVFDNYKFKLQVTAGTSHDTDYEKFVGGQPSPNPDYPQPIRTVTGTQTITINGQDFTLDLGSIELCKLGTYQDYIWKDGEDWKIHKESFFRELNGSEPWNKSNATANNVYILPDLNMALKSPVLADNLTVYTVAYMQTNSVVGIAYNTTGAGEPSTRISVGLDGAATVASFKEWLSTHKTIRLAALATPTETTITDTNLIAQLEAIRAALLEGQNLVEVAANGSNLPAKSITLQGIEGRENPILPQTNVRIGLSDGGVLNACECRQNVTLSMRETA